MSTAIADHNGRVFHLIESARGGATSRAAAIRETPLGRFSFRHLKPPLLAGYRQEDLGRGQRAFVAVPEKALLDIVHLQPGGDDTAYLRELRHDLNVDERVATDACGSPTCTRIANRLYRVVVLRNLVCEARKRGGLTQAALGRRAGVPQSTIARIESGARTPSTDMVERLVRAAGFEIRVRLGEPDPGTASLLQQSLRRTPAERLADAARAAGFVLRGRPQMQDRKRG